MAHQRAEYPLDYSTTVNKQAGDRVQNAADAAADKAAEVKADIPRHLGRCRALCIAAGLVGRRGVRGRCQSDCG